MHVVGKPARWAVGWGKPPPVLRICTATQHSIVQHLERECVRVYGDRVAVERGVRLVGGKVCEGQLLLEDAAGSTQQRQFDLVVGADGVSSVTRRLMAEQDADMVVHVAKSTLRLLSFSLSSPGDAAAVAALPTPSGQPFLVEPPDHDLPPLTGSSYAILRTKPGAEPGMSNCLVCVKHGRSGRVELACVLGGTEEWFGRPRASAAEVAAELAEIWPQMPNAWLEDAAAAVVAPDRHFRPIQFVTCSKLASGRALLVGDAAHAMSPNLGSACNIALQDTLILSEAITAAAGDLPAVARAYDTARRNNAQAVTRISQRIDAASTYKQHRSMLRAAPGWVYSLTFGMNLLPKTVPIPGVLRPSVNLLAGLHEAHGDFRKLEAGAVSYFCRLAVIAATCGAAGVASLGFAWRSLAT
eukprot:jgi/Ulvmu1/5814/UM025_0071.1